MTSHPIDKVPAEKQLGAFMCVTLFTKGVTVNCCVVSMKHSGSEEPAPVVAVIHSFVLPGLVSFVFIDDHMLLGRRQHMTGPKYIIAMFFHFITEEEAAYRQNHDRRTHKLCSYCTCRIRGCI